MSVLGWMTLDGNEVLNEARTLRYLGGGTLPAPSTLTLGDVDACICPAIDGAYVSPAADPAPWVAAGVPISDQFYGLLGVRINEAADLGRTATPRGGNIGGTAFGPETRTRRTISVTGWLVGANDAAVEYGRGWLTSRLASPICDECVTRDLQLRLTCPPEADPGFGLIGIKDVVLTAGPTETDRSRNLGCGYLREYEFTLTAGNPYLLACESACQPRELITTLVPPPLTCGPGNTQMGINDWLCEPGPGVGCQFTSAGGFGVTGGIVTVESGSRPMGPFTIQMDYGTTSLPMRFTGLPPGTTLTVDGLRRDITVNGTPGGAEFLDLTTPYQLPELCTDEDLCATLSVMWDHWCGVPDDAAVTISKGVRYLEGSVPCGTGECP